MHVKIVLLCLYVVLLILASVTITRRSRYRRNQKALLLNMDRKLDALLKHANIEYKPFGNVPPQVVEAIRKGNKVTAVKLYKEATGLPLKEAKEYIDNIEGFIVRDSEW